MNKDTRVDWGPEIEEQFERQASWTLFFRNEIYRKIGLTKAKHILEIGCGMGTITKELRKRTSAKITSIDSDEEMIEVAKKRVDDVEFFVENVENLTLKDNKYDVVVFQYLLLWVKNPIKAMKEIYRVCKKKGHVAALAEPDYGGWVEYPEMNLGKKHIEYLREEGADPLAGRKILSYFESAGFKTEVSVIAQTWNQENLLCNIEEEWKRILNADLISQKEFDQLVRKEKDLINQNRRTIFIPVFTAIGRKS
ncbi:MAG: methyltransferase domain-containing protein [Candidatus Heimdallarchaeota archaeon]|nr:methyltransferase domain-containing protein [Candidatus Heimdallarchaeota archaeon]